MGLAVAECKCMYSERKENQWYEGFTQLASENRQLAIECKKHVYVLVIYLVVLNGIG